MTALKTIEQCALVLYTIVIRHQVLVYYARHRKTEKEKAKQEEEETVVVVNPSQKLSLTEKIAEKAESARRRVTSRR